MQNAPIEILQAIDRLTANSDFARLVSWIDGEHKAAVDNLLDQPNETRVLQLQGYARALRDITLSVTTAHAVLRSHLQHGVVKT